MASLRYLRAVVCLAGLAAPAVAAGQAAPNATLRRAQQAYDNLEYRQVLTRALSAPARTSCSGSPTAPWTRFSRR